MFTSVELSVVLEKVEQGKADTRTTFARHLVEFTRNFGAPSEFSFGTLHISEANRHSVYEDWLTEMADVNPTCVGDITDGLIIVYTIENHIRNLSHTYVVSGLDVLLEFNKIGEELRSAIISSTPLRSRLATFKCSPNFEADVKSLEPVIRAFRHLRKDPLRMYSEMWRGCSIVCFVDIIYEKAIVDALNCIPMEYKETLDEDCDMEMPDLVDPEELFAAARAEAADTAETLDNPCNAE
ncbi:hypothetical protein SCHPADRAFT_892998 [Schizopora paradoxa]|uniref:Uncharacterized protein n=1 Tax=Schizopora paradoxa TaxID=27342 RepID=A0A0H2RCP9_9AGAM|nr:hypothetical protein SCHPADRAFT_892998 [Schizopora paradoxa]